MHQARTVWQKHLEVLSSPDRSTNCTLRISKRCAGRYIVKLKAVQFGSSIHCSLRLAGNCFFDPNEIEVTVIASPGVEGQIPTARRAVKAGTESDVHSPNEPDANQ
jgi:hypothetical protein